jgi:hypothetical protein
MKRVTITLTDDLETAVTAFQDDQAVPPTLTATVQVALEEYLAQRGYLTQPRSHRALRLTPASADADTATDVSAAHDRYLARQ